MKKYKIGNRAGTFIAMVVLFPALQQFYDFLPPDITFPGYESGLSFYFWMGKNMAFLTCLMAWRITFHKWDNDLYRYGWYLFFGYGIMEIFNTFPLEGEGVGMPLAMFMATVTTIAIGTLLPKALRKIRPSYIEELEDQLEREKKLNYYLEFSIDELQRKFRSVGQEEAQRILVGQAYLSKIFGQIERNKDVAEFGRMLYTHSGDIVEAAKSIQRKTEEGQPFSTELKDSRLDVEEIRQSSSSPSN